MLFDFLERYFWWWVSLHLAHIKHAWQSSLPPTLLTSQQAINWSSWEKVHCILHISYILHRSRIRLVALKSRSILSVAVWQLSRPALSRTVLNCARIIISILSLLLGKDIYFQWQFYWLLPWLSSSLRSFLSDEADPPSIWYVRSRRSLLPHRSVEIFREQRIYMGISLWSCRCGEYSSVR